MRAVVYESVLREGVDPASVQRLLRDAVAHNRLAAVTGVLLHDGRRFIQYLEGPDDGMASALGRIHNATSHTGISMLMDGGVLTRLFPNWAMRMVPMGALEVSQVSTANWKTALNGSPVRPGSLTGLQLMLAHIIRLG